MTRTHATLIGLLALGCAAAPAAAAIIQVRPAVTDNTGAGLTEAVRRLAPGDQLVLGAGVYRASIDLRTAAGLRQGATSATPTRIEAAPGAKVVIKGSDIVAGWQRVGTGLFVKRQWRVNSQQVFVNGKSLRQIGGTVFGGFPDRKDHPLASLHAANGGIWPGRVAGGLREMSEGSFFYDAAAQSLYIKLAVASLDGRVVEVSVRPYLMLGESVNKLRVSGIEFAHANTTDVSQSGAIALTGNGLTLDRIHIAHVDGNGFDITGDDNIVTNSSANYCGQVGMKVRGRNVRLTNNETSYNNTRGFNKWWEAGGAKFVGAGGLQDSEVSGHRAYFNRGDGIWFDWKNHNNRLHDSVSAYNTGMGIHYEASSGAFIYNNHIFGNKQRGIYLPKTSQSLVAHNLVLGNGMEGIAVIEDGAQKPEFMPKENRIVANILAWNGKTALVLPSQPLDNVSNANLFVDAQAPALSMGWGSREQPVLRGLPAWRARTGQDKGSWSLQLPMPSSLAEDLSQHTPRPDWSALRERVLKFHVPDTIDAQLSTAVGDTPGPKNL